MGIEEGIFWDEHWVLYGNQFDNKFHIFKKKKSIQLLTAVQVMISQFVVQAPCQPFTDATESAWDSLSFSL